MSRDLAAMLVDWEPVIGLEIHVQLATKSKAFSASGVAFGAEPNSLTDPVVLGLPGALPVFNAAALALALELGVATGSRIRTRSRFARKHYFYPDQPKNYQITQFDEPICEHGHLDVIVGGAVKRVALERIHIEEDAGKNQHFGGVSHVDLNRAGIPLVEVVTAPELTSSEDAAELMRSLHRLVRWLGISEGDMEKGQMRCDANVSVRRRGDPALGTRTELKNINSFRFVQAAIDHEIARQVRIVDGGGRIERETRLWDGAAGQSAPLRSKEEANDYRYFPDPDLPPLVASGAMMAEILRRLPELPAARFERYQREFMMTPDDARTLVSSRALADYFEAAVGQAPGTPKAIANWVLGDLFAALNAAGVEIAASPMAPVTLAEIVTLVDGGTSSGKIGKEVFEESFRTGEAPGAIVERRGVQQISDVPTLWEVINRVVATNVKQAEAYTGGKDSLFAFFVGQVMKETQGRANPAVAADLLRKRLGR